MQRINEKFEKLNIIYRNHPLISFLNDNTKPPLGKLSFIPLLSPKIFRVTNHDLEFK
ncbi:hypothetical protein QEJ31_09615 [Pigmentibacter sp. JX0631]|uniref:hypothetical protein n=1 Tax=Pigmentibacter sp. JX0631 TaxID=2976982 RepID=UPI0024694C3D|nr:hypothetical protein [Pigmentibacter sp. JX0631]WGL58782.1 hypothetical protein QEJ31_09615 [Pigmentibacter sp. JX0631]